MFRRLAAKPAFILLLVCVLILALNVRPTSSAGEPILTVLEPEIEGATVSVNGVVSPGNPGTHIERIHWDWGDGTSEDHWFPASHSYSQSGYYTITVRAHQSDGLTAAQTKEVTIQIPSPPPTVLMLVNENIYLQIRSRLSMFEQDLAREGYRVMNVTVREEATPPEIKEVISSHYYSVENLVGALLIGNIRAAYTEIRTGDYSNPEALKIYVSLDAADMYYMDLDGYWEHVTHPDFSAHKPPNVAEVHLYESCRTFYNQYIVYPDETKKWDYWQVEDKTQYKAEIWIARIMAHNLAITGWNETQIINEFFDWNHDYRTGIYDVASKAYILCSGPGYNEQEMDYSIRFDTVTKRENVTKNDFIACLADPNGSKVMYLTAHSWPQGHALSDVSVRVDELDQQNKTSVFYILNACSACRWDQHVTTPADPNYLGGLYVFDTGKSSRNHGLGAVGFTGVGGFNFLKYFTDALNSNTQATFGEAYTYWFNNNLMHLFGVNNYVFLGDPTIGPKHPKAVTHDVAITSIRSYRTVLTNNVSAAINVTAENPGSFSETFNVTLYCNTTRMHTQTLTLTAGQSLVLRFEWPTPSTPGTYKIRAVAEAVGNETVTTNNEFIYMVQVSILGDLNVDAVINILDIAQAAFAYGTKLGDDRWNVNADVNEDRRINILDIALIAKEYGETG